MLYKGIVFKFVHYDLFSVFPLPETDNLLFFNIIFGNKFNSVNHPSYKVMEKKAALASDWWPTLILIDLIDFL